MERRRFLHLATAVSVAPLAGCGKRNIIPANPTLGPSYGQALLAQLNYVASIFPDTQRLALLKQIASSPNVTAEQLEVCWQLMGDFVNQSTVPVQGTAPVFPQDHALHPNCSIEWYYFTLSLPLSDGRLVSVITNFFRKTLAPSSLSPGAGGALGRSLCSTSIGVTIETPGQPGQHYSWPVGCYFGSDPAVQYSASPFTWALGKQSIVGGPNVFPLHIHLEDPGDASQNRPPIIIDVDCAATNPLFLEGVDGYDGNGATNYYYYSWPEQATTGTVTISGTPYAITSGVAWMDHQWGGGAPATSATTLDNWTGWSWFECQLGGNNAITLSVLHNSLANGYEPAPLAPGVIGFGTYVSGSTSELVIVTSYSIPSFTVSPATGGEYPSAWNLQVINAPGTSIPIDLALVPTASTKPQALWMGGIVEYAEAATSWAATGMIGGLSVSLSGVGYCESVGFQNPSAATAAQTVYLQNGTMPSGY